MNQQPKATEEDIAACRAFAAGYASAKEEVRVAGPPRVAVKAAGAAILLAVSVSLACVIAAWRRGDDVAAPFYSPLIEAVPVLTFVAVIGLIFLLS